MLRRLHLETGMRYGGHRDLRRERGNNALPDPRSLSLLHCYLAFTSLRISWVRSSYCVGAQTESKESTK